MAYADVDVIVEGALDAHETFETDEQVDAFIERVEADAEADGLLTEVYVLWHEHDLTDEECGCAQYVTDGHPSYVWNDTD